MDLSHDHDRKGLVATILIHSIIFLLMLIWIMGEAKDMEEPAGGVEVSFGDPAAGGPSDVSQVCKHYAGCSRLLPTLTLLTTPNDESCCDQ